MQTMAEQAVEGVGAGEDGYESSLDGDERPESEEEEGAEPAPPDDLRHGDGFSSSAEGRVLIHRLGHCRKRAALLLLFLRPRLVFRTLQVLPHALYTHEKP